MKSIMLAKKVENSKFNDLTHKVTILTEVKDEKVERADYLYFVSSLDNGITKRCQIREYITKVKARKLHNELIKAGYKTYINKI